MIPIDIEIILNSHSNISKQSLTTLIQSFLEAKKVRPNSIITDFEKEENNFYFYVKCVIIGNVADYYEAYLDFNKLKVNWFVYTLDSYGPVHDTNTSEDGEQVNIATHLTLPSLDLYDLWESLYYEDNVKENLLKYARTMIEFSDKGVNPNIVSCNRVILLHGPPGTGKTSLCKALAQKLSVQLSERFNSGLLIEVNSHSLFSKWFSQSGKQVANMFLKVKEVCENENILVCVLIDEVESLTRARDQCMSGNEPSDAIRVVNAVLTQIDQIKRYPNALILATSNMTEAIDLAFVDRADVKQFLGFPSVPAIYKIYHSCLMELIRTQIIKCNPQAINEVKSVFTDNNNSDYLDEDNKKLICLCENSVGLSGRSLRKIPFLAHSLLIGRKANLSDFLNAMEYAIDIEKANKQNFAIKK